MAGRSLPYTNSWIFETAAPVLKSGGRLILVGLKTAKSLIWAVGDGEDVIDSLGFTKVVPTKPSGKGVHGLSIEAEERFKSMEGSFTIVLNPAHPTFSMKNARQIEYKKKYLFGF